MIQPLRMATVEAVVNVPAIPSLVFGVERPPRSTAVVVLAIRWWRRKGAQSGMIKIVDPMRIRRWSRDSIGGLMMMMMMMMMLLIMVTAAEECDVSSLDHVGM